MLKTKFHEWGSCCWSWCTSNAPGSDGGGLQGRKTVSFQWLFKRLDAGGRRHGAQLLNNCLRSRICVASQLPYSVLNEMIATACAQHRREAGDPRRQQPVRWRVCRIWSQRMSLSGRSKGKLDDPRSVATSTMSAQTPFESGDPSRASWGDWWPTERSGPSAGRMASPPFLPLGRFDCPAAGGLKRVGDSLARSADLCQRQISNPLKPL